MRIDRLTDVIKKLIISNWQKLHVLKLFSESRMENNLISQYIIEKIFIKEECHICCCTSAVQIGASYKLGKEQWVFKDLRRMELHLRQK